MKELTRIATVEITVIRKAKTYPSPAQDEQFERALLDTIRATVHPDDVQLVKLQNFVRDEKRSGNGE